MPRPYKCRNIGGRPTAGGFKPSGVRGRQLERVGLRLDELEALRLADLEGLYHAGAAERMGVSRATFGRLVEGARRKVADALVNGKMLTFEGGEVNVMSERTFVCADCGQRFGVAFGLGRPTECPSCSSPRFGRAPEERDGARGAGVGVGGGGRGRRRRFRGGSA